MPPASLRFDPFELQPAQRRLLRAGAPVLLRARAFDLLVVLVERAGSLVTKGELLDLVWPGLVVEENNIAAQVAALRRTLGGDFIATVPGRGYRFTAEVHPSMTSRPIVAAEPAPAAPRARGATRLVGRDDDLARLRAALEAGRCVSLVGPGGVGKTVLAREAAATWPTAKRSWIDLAALTDGSEIAGALHRELGVAAAGPDTDAALATALADGRLLILDNAEHVIAATAVLVAALLATAPTLTLLVTSQVPLRVAAERVQPVEPLALPAESLADDEIDATPAVQLLVERLRAVDPHLAIGPDARPLLRRLVVRLDGLPLALEMAAAVVPMLGLRGVLDALDQRFAVLRRGQRNAMPRHQTLRAAIEWSHGLLEPDARRLLRRLAVFPDAFALELAITAAGDEGADRWAVVDVLTELVDRSLVVRLPVPLPADPPRFRLLESMRSFALDDLRGSGEEGAARLRAVTALTGHLRQAAATDAHAYDLAHVPELAAWARAQAPVAAIDLTLAAAAVAVWTPWLSDAARWIEACEPLLDASVPSPMQAAWWRELARYQTFVRGRRAVEAARNASAIERALGNDDGLFWSLIPLLRSRVLETDEFEQRRDEAQALIDRHPEWPARQRVVFSGSLAMEYRRRGDFARAWRHQQDEADEAGRAGLRQAADNAQSNLAATLIGLGRREEALALIATLLARTDGIASAVDAHNRIRRLDALVGLRRLDEAQATAAETLAWGRRYDILEVLPTLALLAALQGRLPVAALLLGHYRQRLAAHGADLPDDAHAPWREASSIVAASLDAALLQHLMERGARLTPQEVDAQWLDAQPHDDPGDAHDALPTARTA